MSMGVVNDSDFENELSKLSGQTPKSVQVIDINRGRPLGRKEVSEEKRAEIAREAITSDMTGIELAKKHGVSTASVSAYKNGATSTASYNNPDPSLANHNNQIREQILGSARSRLIEALAEITPDKVSGAKIKDIAGIAKDMSAVIRNVEPNILVNQNNTQVLVYRPKQNEESDYEVIQVNE